MSDKACIVFWVNMRTMKLESAGVYPDAPPTHNKHTRDTIPVTYAVYTRSGSYDDASVPANRGLHDLVARFPDLKTSTESSTPDPRNVPTFYCGRCKQHFPHYCPSEG